MKSCDIIFLIKMLIDIQEQSLEDSDATVAELGATDESILTLLAIRKVVVREESINREQDFQLSRRRSEYLKAVSYGLLLCLILGIIPIMS